jgi:hypothetical protein
VFFACVLLLICSAVALEAWLWGAKSVYDVTMFYMEQWNGLEEVDSETRA